MMITSRKRKLTARRVIINIITFRWLFLGLVLLYKKTLSHVMGKGCLYNPTCSTYMYVAIEEFGVIRGVGMGIYRILRCNPLSRGGFDPVPDNPRGDKKWLF